MCIRDSGALGVHGFSLVENQEHRCGALGAHGFSLVENQEHRCGAFGVHGFSLVKNQEHQENQEQTAANHSGALGF